jgi:ribosomal protein L16/L10AE
MRMGKGAGKLNSWSINMKSGVFVIEFKNLRLGRAKFFFKKIITKIPTRTSMIFTNNRNIKLNSIRSTNVTYTNFW